MKVVCSCLALAFSFCLINLAWAENQDKDKQDKDKQKKQVLEVGKKGINLDSKLDDTDAGYGDNKVHAKLFLVKMVKGKTYQIDMSTNNFDAYLYLEDPGKKLLAEDDDTGGGDTMLDAQIVVTPTDDGVYRIIATSFEGDKTGNFKLTVIEK
jgi:hypothetical protein